MSDVTGLSRDERLALAKRVLEVGVQDAADIWGPNGESSCASIDGDVWRRGLLALREAQDAYLRALEILGPELVGELESEADDA